MALPYANDAEVCDPVGRSGVVDADVVGPDERGEAGNVPDVVRGDPVARSVDAMRAELSERDGELRDVLARLAALYGRIDDDQVRRAGPPSDRSDRSDPSDRTALDGHALRALLRSTDHLATVTEASVDRVGDVTRSLERMAEAVQGVATRVDRLVRRADESEARIERLVHLTESLRGEVADLRRDHRSRPRPPRLRAVGDDPATPKAR